ncbi:bifunctional hydroxymethylpyrimidine kinase/phosphomethylpyrimidine kinase [Wohlfahrtiimonas chitiniclastica]|uniref:bifunctional hydroxymethylpyrimidine kinase/phosphomethylpyrimidine kinase n=1 Tax=Wohlfahrtiimonas chitiniclastica TaxID=400946 RepID=UPI000B98BE21|nr:bifunctional hydroxymethylpyrimidine kinase/phosphomethylpyrimidine kinase [Wohlfahrtiimonas chitiniclastica]OYQ79023.1 bifunctional hydroxymethylpyrimidine kinase/phosphomethylpyrimidine kinase [Wohlfahrtiimonas chitiniclastica]
MKKILTIAGSDSSGGAGIQADLRTFAKHDLYGFCALTVIVTMETDTWSHGVFPIELPVIDAQIKTALEGVGVDAIKLGMLPTPAIIENVDGYLKTWAKKVPVVVDPVMVCKGNKPLFPEHAEAIRTHLIKHATVTTPNLFEAAQLAGMEEITNYEEVKEAARRILALGCQAVAITNVGRVMAPKTSGDLFYDGHEFVLMEGAFIDTHHTHGLGCTFAAHVAANLCKGFSPRESVFEAKEAIKKGIKNHWALNQFVGTLDFPDSFK